MVGSLVLIKELPLKLLVRKKARAACVPKEVIEPVEIPSLKKKGKNSNEIHGKILRGIGIKKICVHQPDF